VSTIDFLLTQTSDAVAKFRDLKKDNPEGQGYIWLEAAASSALRKCENYHKLMDDSAAYCAAEVLQLGRKWNWVRKKWHNDPNKRRRLDSSKRAVQELWEEEYRGKFSAQELPTPDSQPGQANVRDRPSRQPNDNFNLLANYRKAGDDDITAGDTFQEYLARGPKPGRTVRHQ
jgi:hypothetical protein